MKTVHSVMGQLRESMPTKIILRTDRLQQQFSILIDNTRLRELVTSMAQATNTSDDMRRLQELRDAGVNHAWLWHLDHSTGEVLTEEEYVIAVRLRLGCEFLTDVVPCRLCVEPLDRKLDHSSCCAKSVRTRRHYAIVRSCMNRFKIADHAAQIEQRGVAESEIAACPADIFTSVAIPGREAALDTSVPSPHAGHAGRDCNESAWRRKHDRYSQLIDEVRSDGIAFRPVLRSSEGRPHSTAIRIVSYASTSTMVARKFDGVQAPIVRRRWDEEIGILLAAARPRMAMAYFPRMDPHDAVVMFGEGECEAS